MSVKIITPNLRKTGRLLYKVRDYVNFFTLNFLRPELVDPYLSRPVKLLILSPEPQENRHVLRPYTTTQ